MANSEQVAKGFQRPRSKPVKGGGADWDSVDAELIRKAISRAGLKRGALRFGYTRDGGAYAVGVYAGTEYFTEYVRPDEDIVEYLEQLIESFDAVDLYDAIHSTTGARSKRSK